jgi:hypothetical protein
VTDDRTRSAGGRFGHVAVATLAALLALPATSAIATVPSGSAPDTSSIVAHRSGDLMLVDAGTRSQEVERGGSSSELALKTPADAQCPGDSRNDAWRVQTFVVPVADDPGALTYTVIGPGGPGQFAVYGTDYTPLVDEFTVPNDVQGQPGRIDQMRPVSFGVFEPGSLPDGTYRIGVACTYFGATADYWDTEIEVVASPTDQPAQLTWRLAGSPANAAATTDDSISPWLLLAIAGVLATAVALLVRRRRAHSARPSTASGIVPATTPQPASKESR